MFFGGGGGMGGGFPFEGMGGMGGRPSGPVDNKKLYETLGISQKATADEIRKAYRKLALKEHPDRGGDKEKF
jgi:DnaJ family protein A protein 2